MMPVSSSDKIKGAIPVAAKRIFLDHLRYYERQLGVLQKRSFARFWALCAGGLLIWEPRITQCRVPKSYVF